MWLFLDALNALCMYITYLTCCKISSTAKDTSLMDVSWLQLEVVPGYFAEISWNDILPKTEK